MAFPPLGNFDHVVASVSIDFPINLKQDTPFHRVAYDYSCADWDGLCDNLRDIPWEDIFKLSASGTASEFCEWIQVGIDVYIPHRKYQVKHHSSPWLSAACAAAIVHRNHFFRLYQQNKSLESKVKSRQARNRCKRVLEAAKFAYALGTFGELLIVFSTKVNLLYLLCSTDWRCCLLHLIKQNYLLKTFPRALILMTLVSLYRFSLLEITNPKLRNISITPKMVKKVIANLDSSKVSGPDCILVVVLKNCEPEISFILAKLFNMCLKESYFPDCWKVSLVVPVFKNVGERSTAKNYCPVSLLSVVSKVFKRLVNNRIVDHLERCDLFLISSMVLGLLDQLQIF